MQKIKNLVDAESKHFGIEIVDVRIFDLNGKVVKNLVKDKNQVGHNSIQWDATNDQGQKVSAGVYIYSLEAGDFRQARKMVLLK